MNAIELLRNRWKTLLALGVVAGGLGLSWGRIAKMVANAEPVATAQAAEDVGARSLRAEGRLVTYPGAEVVVGTDVGGTLAKVVVAEGTKVKKGDLLVEIDSSEQRAALAEARARAAEADVDAKFLDVELDRSERLVSSGAIGKATLDKSQHDRDAAKARLHEASATAQRLSVVVGKSRITTPIDGVVVDRLVEQGETVAAGAQIVRIADLSRTRIEAEVDESDAGRVALGQPVTLSVEGYPHAAWKGHVEEVPDTVTSRRLKPEDPGRPSDTRVLLVKVALDEAVPFKLGQRVQIEIKAPPRP